VRPETERFLDKARQCLEHARAILAIGLGEDAGRAAYIAGFHAAQAFIFEKVGKAAKTHQGVQSQFLKLTKDDAAIAPDLLIFLSRAYQLKSVADYETGPDAIVPVERAAEAIATAERFIAEIARKLSPKA
jgi:uncharacterized protein (UPF0332 family)